MLTESVKVLYLAHTRVEPGAKPVTTPPLDTFAIDSLSLVHEYSYEWRVELGRLPLLQLTEGSSDTLSNILIVFSQGSERWPGGAGKGEPE